MPVHNGSIEGIIQLRRAQLKSRLHQLRTAAGGVHCPLSTSGLGQ